MLTRLHWANDLHDAGCRPRYMFKTKASHLDGGHRLWSGMERDGLRRATLPKFAPLFALDNQDTEIDILINSFNTTVTETANNILGKHRPAKKLWVTDNILKLCDKRRELKQKKNTTEDAKLYREANQQVKKKA